jgi:hypothetical protein
MTACYYCINVSSNEMCNRFAIETPCSTGKKWPAISSLDIPVFETIFIEMRIFVRERS